MSMAILQVNVPPSGNNILMHEQLKRCLTAYRTWIFVSYLPYNSLCPAVWWYGALARNINFQVVHVLGIPETFSVPPQVIISYTDMHHGTCVMHAVIANWRFPLKSVEGKTFPAFPAACVPRNFTYLVRGNLGRFYSLCYASNFWLGYFGCWSISDRLFRYTHCHMIGHVTT